MKLYIVLAIALNVSIAYGLFDIDTVDDLDLNKYSGRWYEIYNSLIQRSTFQKNFYCTTADYTLKDGVVQVVNAGRVGGPKGKATDIKGTAKVVDSKEPGALNVNFPTGPSFQRKSANYLVVKLGPVNSDGKYDYTIITAPLKAFVWVLARDVKQFKETYDTEVNEYLKKNGYDWFWNKPKPTYQGDDCIYA